MTEGFTVNTRVKSGSSVSLKELIVHQQQDISIRLFLAWAGRAGRTQLAVCGDLQEDEDGAQKTFCRAELALPPPAAWSWTLKPDLLSETQETQMLVL